MNTTGKKQPININLNGAAKFSPEAILFVINGKKPEDTNTITDPENIIPVSTKIKGIASKFKRMLDPYSVSVFQLQIKK